MADEKSTAPGEKPRRRPAPTIDLSATEVKADPPPQAPKPELAAETTSPRGSLIATYAVGGLLIGVLLGAGALWFAGVREDKSTNTSALTARLAVLEGQLREQSQRPPAAEPKPEIKAEPKVETKIEPKPEAAKPAAPDAALTDRIAAIEAGLGTLNKTAQELQSSLQRPEPQPQSQAALDALGKRLDAIEQAARMTQDKVAQNTGADAAARQALATMTLRDAVSRGAPYAAELAAVKNLGGDPEAIAALEPFAASGLPSDSVLARELASLLPAMIKAADADPARAGGFIERLEANAGRLVRIRRVGEPAGDDPAAVLARIEVKAARADIASVRNDIAALPAKARAVAEPWSRKVPARDAADKAARKLVADSAAALGGK
jgi:hypothetical protein